ncbi:MAG: radical SAM protein, partial [Malacoplasma sp.]|nr:radical SAM protein [Malacoplasma sp.]
MSMLRINSIMENPSLCDGKGYRTVLFLQGCNLRCKGCHNKSTWEINAGQLISSSELATILRSKCLNKKLTISGGEPLLQADALIDLLEELKDFDLCLYTGHQLKDVPKKILSYLKYIKTGPYIEALKTSTKPFVGSTNQEFIEVKKDDTTKQKH